MARNRNKRWNKTILAVVVIVGAAILFATQLTIFNVPPIGAIPEGRTIVIWRLNSLQFLDSSDAWCERQQGKVTLLCRGLILANIGQQGSVIAHFPYSETLYNWSFRGSNISLPKQRQEWNASSYDREKKCDLSEIEVKNISFRKSTSHLYITGIVENNCVHETGVELKLTIYREDGSVYTSKEFWPASINNIRPFEDYPFETMVGIEGYLRTSPNDWTYDIRVIDAKQW